MAHPE